MKHECDICSHPEVSALCIRLRLWLLHESQSPVSLLSGLDSLARTEALAKCRRLDRNENPQCRAVTSTVALSVRKTVSRGMRYA